MSATPALHPPSRELVAGMPVDPVSMHDAVDLVLRRARGEPGAYVCLTNAHSTGESQRVPELRAAAEGAFLSVPDGMPLVWILRRRGHRPTQKVTGIEFVPQVAAAGVPAGIRHFFWGGAPGVAEAAGRALERLVPGTLVVGAGSPPMGPYQDWDLRDLHAALERTQPHVMWVGLGAPKQELWMARAARELQVPVMVGVGAAFDYLAGVKRPAPRVMSRLGLEWLFRLASEPRRLWRRYVLGNAYFVYLIARAALRHRPSGG